MKDEDICLNGLSCLKCGKGWYPGYNGDKVNPCNVCGDIQPATMKHREYIKLEREKVEKIKNNIIPFEKKEDKEYRLSRERAIKRLLDHANKLGW